MLPNGRPSVHNEASVRNAGVVVSLAQPESGLSVLFRFQRQGIDIAGRYIAKQLEVHRRGPIQTITCVLT
jgi:hypothetical protein